MYTDHHSNDDSSASDDSFYPRKNMTIKLKDLARNNSKPGEDRAGIHQKDEYVMSSLNELTTAVEKERIKSLLTKGNSTMRRKPPPPPSLTSSSFLEQSENIDTKIVLNRMTKKNIEPTKKRVMERVDYSPLTSPENIRFAR